MCTGMSFCSLFHLVSPLPLTPAATNRSPPHLTHFQFQNQQRCRKWKVPFCSAPQEKCSRPPTKADEKMVYSPLGAGTGQRETDSNSTSVAASQGTASVMCSTNGTESAQDKAGACLPQMYSPKEAGAVQDTAGAKCSPVDAGASARWTARGKTATRSGALRPRAQSQCGGACHFPYAALHPIRVQKAKNLHHLLTPGEWCNFAKM